MHGPYGLEGNTHPQIPLMSQTQKREYRLSLGRCAVLSLNVRQSIQPPALEVFPVYRIQQDTRRLSVRSHQFHDESPPEWVSASSNIYRPGSRVIRASDFLVDRRTATGSCTTFAIAKDVNMCPMTAMVQLETERKRKRLMT